MGTLASTFEKNVNSCRDAHLRASWFFAVETSIQGRSAIVNLHLTHQLFLHIFWACLFCESKGT